MRVIATLIVGLVLLAGCAEFKLPGEEEMNEVFAPKRSIRLEEPAAPESIPLLATGEMSDWRPLCNQCHVGPNYSSYTILNWGHKEVCITDMVCNECHANELHLTNVRGDKAACLDCHLGRNVARTCETCHPADWRDQHTAHEPGSENAHKLLEEWDQIDCMACHGSRSWCLDCHGLEMPHPEDNMTSHVQLVQGQPEVCANCHGPQSCVACHNERGISLKQ